MSRFTLVDVEHLPASALEAIKVSCRREAARVLKLVSHPVHSAHVEAYRNLQESANKASDELFRRRAGRRRIPHD